jgi:hypothetical protein
MPLATSWGKNNKTQGTYWECNWWPFGTCGKTHDKRGENTKMQKIKHHTNNNNVYW